MTSSSTVGSPQPTKKNIRARDWCFTINNPTEDDRKQLRTVIEEASYLVVQMETGKNNTKHLQGFVQFENARAFNTMRNKLTRAHLEKRRGTPTEAANYCKDATKRVKNTEYKEFGQLTEYEVKKSKLEQVKTMIDAGMSMREVIDLNPTQILNERNLISYRKRRKGEIAQTHLRDNLLVVWIHGETATGKSFSTWRDYPEAYRITDSKNPWDNYDFQDVVVFDDWQDKNYPVISNMLHWLDIYPVQLSARYENSWADYTLVIITSNQSPEEAYWKEFRDQQGNMDRYLTVSEKHKNAFLRRIHISTTLNDDYDFEYGFHQFKTIPDLIQAYQRSKIKSKELSEFF